MGYLNDKIGCDAIISYVTLFQRDLEVPMELTAVYSLRPRVIFRAF